jgi:hypothetical protein
MEQMKMKTYQVELKRTSYVTFEIEARSEEDAEAFAWDRLNGYYNEDASWEIESTQEMESC